MSDMNLADGGQDLDAVMRPGAYDNEDLDDTSGDDFGSDFGGGGEAEQTSQQAEPEPEPEPKQTESQEAEPEPEQTTAETEEADETEDVSQEADSGEQQSEPGEQRIPKHRFDQVNERRKAAERRLQELEQQRKAGQPEEVQNFDFQAKEKEYMDAVLDGETQKALNIREEIRAAEQAQIQAQIREAENSSKAQTKAELELQEVISEAQSSYPEFDATSERFDEELNNEALELFESFKTRGYDAPTAMRRAVRYTTRAFGIDGPQAQQTQQTEQQQPQQQSTRKRQQNPKPQQVKEKLETATQQPPQTTSQSVDDTPDVANMPEEQFDKLSKEDEKIARGDFV